MQLVSYDQNGQPGLALSSPEGLKALAQGDLQSLIAAGELSSAADHLDAAPLLDPGTLSYAPVIRRPGKILCVGLNYAEHAAETGSKTTPYPTFFLRTATTLVGHDQPILRPAISDQLDFEGEITAVIGRPTKDIAEDRALDAVAGYTLFNDASVRDYQRATSQFTMGKNFDATGGFGPALVTPDELPEGCAGLTLTTRLNGEIVQQASTDDMIFPIARIIALASQVMTLEPGDVVVTGTPAGVGAGRTPPLWMRPGDTVEVEVPGLGTLRNPLAQG